MLLKESLQKANVTMFTHHGASEGHFLGIPLRSMSY